ncbi:MAG: sulfatase [Candidatus Alcyoniella australis]|nr:sulfatase [Candidatus Alcyoniella australis]
MRHGQGIGGLLWSLVLAAAVGGPAELLGSAALRPDLLYGPTVVLPLLAAGALQWTALAVLLAPLMWIVGNALGGGRFWRALTIIAPSGCALAVVVALRAFQLFGGGESWTAALSLGLPLLLIAALTLLVALLFARQSARRSVMAAIGIVLLLLGVSYRLIAEQGAQNRRTDYGVSLVLVTLDTLRVDYLGLYGSEHGLTPNLDRLAQSSICFDLAYCTQPETTPSHATIISGLEPLNHGAWRGNGHPIGSHVTTLAQMLGLAGYRCGAFVSGYPLDRAFGLGRGFAVYDDAFAGRLRSFLSLPSLLDEMRSRLGDYVLERDGALTVDAALAWLDRAPQPFLLWVHLYDAHHPYLDHEGNFDPELVEAVNRRWFEDEQQPGEAELIKQLYASEVRYVDQQLGRLIDGLAQRGLLDELALAVVGDHGEGLGDHGYKWHSERLYEEQVRVPLLIRLPRSRLGGTRINALARTADIVPTLYMLALPGAFLPAATDGVDLSAAFDGEEEAMGEPALMLTRKGLTAGTDGQLKLILPADHGAPSAYELLLDPGEAEPLARIPEEGDPLLEQVKALSDLLTRLGPDSAD